MAEHFTIPVPVPDFPLTREDCQEDPAVCPFMQGLLLVKTMFDAHCTKPFPDTGFTQVIVAGWQETMTVQNQQVPYIKCGKCDFQTGVARKYGV